MNIADVMDELGAALETIPDLRVFPYWADRVTPPAAVVTWPEVTYDLTFVRGGDRLEIPLITLTGKVDARSARDLAAQYADGSGTHSVKVAVESYAATGWDSARVERVEFGVTSVAAVEYLSATFYVDIVGPGS